MVTQTKGNNMKHTPEYKALVEIINCDIGDDVKYIQKVDSIALDAVVNYELVQDDLIEVCQEVVNSVMDNGQFIVSYKTIIKAKIAIKKAKGE